MEWYVAQIYATSTRHGSETFHDVSYCIVPEIDIIYCVQIHVALM